MYICAKDSIRAPGTFGFLVFRYGLTLYSPGCSGTSSVDQAGLEFVDIYLPSTETKGVFHHYPVYF